MLRQRAAARRKAEEQARQLELEAVAKARAEEEAEKCIVDSVRIALQAAEAALPVAQALLPLLGHAGPDLQVSLYFVWYQFFLCFSFLPYFSLPQSSTSYLN